MACVYRHIRLDKNEPFYIGVGKSAKRADDVSDRSFEWMKIATSGYGAEVMIDDIDMDVAFEKEIEFIALYGRIKNGTGTLVNNNAGGIGNLVHGYHRHPMYQSYENIKRRDDRLCDEWENDFMVFNNWCLSNGWEKGCMIYRKDKNLMFSPENCGIKKILKIEYNSKLYTVMELAKIINIKRHTLHRRIELGWSIDEILSTPVSKHNRYVHKKIKNGNKSHSGSRS